MIWYEALASGKLCRGYKVTTTWDGKYRSFCLHTLRGIVYHPYIWSIPKVDHGPMAVFDSVQAAKDATFHSGPLVRIWKCWYVKSEGNKLYTPRSGFVALERLPLGTVLADAVMITKMIHISRRGQYLT